MEQAFVNYFEPHWNNDHKCLQLKIYFDLSYYMGRRAKQGLRALRKDSFNLGVTPEGREYLELKYNEATKKSQGDDYREIHGNAILMAQPDSPRCPVASFKLYLAKLTHLPDLFQQPNPNFKRIEDKWYKASPVGVNQIAKFLSEISYFAGLNKRYTNHSMRGTTLNAMKRKDRSIPEMAFVLKHKNLQSLASYLDDPTLEEKESIADDLFDFTHKDEPTSIAQNPTPQAQPPTKKSRLSLNKKSKPAETLAKPPEEIENKNPEPKEHPTTPPHTNNPLQLAVKSPLVPLSPNLNVEVPSNNVNANFMQMYKQNPIGMFMGANLSGCTININMPK